MLQTLEQKLFAYIYIYTSTYGLPFGNIVTCSIAAAQIILWWTLPKFKFYGIARSKWVDYIYTYIYIHVHLTKRLYIATWLPAAWLGSGSDFYQICLKTHFMELQVRMGWLLHTHTYIYIYIYKYIIYEIWLSINSYGYPELCFRTLEMLDYSINSSILSSCLLKMSCSLSIYIYICISHKTYLKR